MSATPATMDNYFTQYKSIVGENGEKLSLDRQFAFDETGIMRGMGVRNRVVSGQNNNAAKVNKGSSRELITFVPVICANGELVTSLAIFPGKLLRKDWVERNPGGVATTCSTKGYMNNILGLAFIKQFHEATAHLEEGGPRLLHVDSHSSHVNLPVLDFAIQHNIIVFGYPPHTTNLTQGLDVVVFGPFKKAYAKHAANHLADMGSEVQKKDFLTVLHMAVQESFTKDNIFAAWRKTGLRPVNRAAIDDMALAPSKAFSTTQSLPTAPFSPIKAVVDAIHRQNRLCEAPISPTLPLASVVASDPSTNSRIDLFPCLLNNQGTGNADGEVASTQMPAMATHVSMEQSASGMVELGPNHLDILIEGLCDRSDALAPDISPDLNSLTETHAINTAGDILRSLATTSYAPILELETVSSAIPPPPVECGPFPTKLAEILKHHDGLPSEALWSAVKDEFIRLVPRAERLLATNILQHTFCQQMQRKLFHKEGTQKKPSLQKVPGFENGLIFTSAHVRDALALQAEERDVQQIEAERKKDLKDLRQEAQKWKEVAEEARKEEHKRLIANWKALPVKERPSRRQPAKPPLAPMPERYQEVLCKKKGQPSKPKRKQARDDSDTYSDDSD